MNNTISLEEAVKMTTLYRGQKDLILKPEFLGKNILVISETLERGAIDAILSQPDCVGLRIYKGMKENLQIKSVIIGVNSKGDDMLPEIPNEIGVSATTGNTIAEDATTCPPICPKPSALNPA